MDQHDQLLNAGRILIFLGLLGGGALGAAETAAPFVATVPAGGPDPASAINREIERVSEAGGGTVMLAPGVYELSAPVELKTGVRLVGDGGLLSDDTPRSDYATTLRAQTALPALVEAINADGARLEHLTLDGAGRVENGVKTASYALRMRDCAVRGMERRGVWVTDGKPLGHDMYVQATFINCFFDQGGKGIGIEGARDPARHPPGTPAQVHRGAFTDGVISRCRFANIGEAAAAICGGWQFFGSEVSGAGSLGGVVVFGGATTVNDNDIETTAGPAVAVKLGNVAITRNRLVRRGKGDVISVDPDLKAVTISRNHWAGSGGYFVDFTGPWSVRDSAVFGNLGEGEPASNLDASSEGLYLADNTTGDTPNWEPEALARRAAPPPIRAVISIEGADAVAKDPAGHEIASDPDPANTINAAIRTVAREGGGAIFVAHGTYICGGPIALQSGIVLAGEGGMSRIPVGFEAMGTVLKAGPNDAGAVVDLTDASGAGVDELAVDGSLVASACLRLAAHSAWIDNCFIERARKYAIEVTNGEDTSPGAYSGMLVADVLVHAGADATGLAVHADPSAGGHLPDAGTVDDARLRLGLVQASFTGGSGWKLVGNHGTSNGHSTVGFVLDADAMVVAGNYFDTVHGPRIHIGGKGVDVIGCHFQQTPTEEFPAIVIAGTAQRVSVESSTWHPPTGKLSRDSVFAELSDTPAADTRLVGNVGEGVCQILDPPDALPAAQCAGNFVAPPSSFARFDAGK